MADPKGLKRICMSCGARFYDLSKKPIICPSCNTEFTGEIKVKARRGRLSDVADAEEEIEAVVEEAVVETEEVEADEETVSLEEIAEDDDDADEDEIPLDDDLTIDDDLDDVEDDDIEEDIAEDEEK